MKRSNQIQLTLKYSYVWMLTFLILSFFTFSCRNESGNSNEENKGQQPPKEEKVFTDIDFVLNLHSMDKLHRDNLLHNSGYSSTAIYFGDKKVIGLGRSNSNYEFNYCSNEWEYFTYDSADGSTVEFVVVNTVIISKILNALTTDRFKKIKGDTYKTNNKNIKITQKLICDKPVYSFLIS